MASNKEMRKLAKEAEACGYAVNKTKVGHYKIVENLPTGKRTLVISFSPGSNGAEKHYKRMFEKFKRGEAI